MAGARRIDLQAAAQAKIDDAQHLLNLHRFSNAYYLAGYSIEIGLKACIAKQFTADTIPDRKFVMDIHVHDLKKLIGLSGLTSALKQREVASAQFAANWALTTEWSPEVRYEAVDPMLAQFMISAIIEPTDGVLPWIKTVW